jgi:cell division protein FtsL
MKLSLQFRKRSALLVIVMIAATVGSAFAIVWMQQQISRTAHSTNQFEAELAEVVRKIDYLDERIATLHQPVVLQGKVAGNLRPSLENQVVWVREREMPSGRAYAVARPYEVSLDLAMLEVERSR